MHLCIGGSRSVSVVDAVHDVVVLGHHRRHHGFQRRRHGGREEHGLALGRQIRDDLLNVSRKALGEEEEQLVQGLSRNIRDRGIGSEREGATQVDKN